MNMRQLELTRLWNQMRQLERHPIKGEADFAWKKKEMEALKAAYDKLSGTSGDPYDFQQNEAKGDAAFYDQAMNRDDVQPDADRLNKGPMGR